MQQIIFRKKEKRVMKVEKVEAVRNKLKSMNDFDIVAGMFSGALKADILESSQALVEMLPIYAKVPEMLFLSIIPQNKRNLFVKYSELKLAYDSYIAELTIN